MYVVEILDLLVFGEVQPLEIWHGKLDKIVFSGLADDVPCEYFDCEVHGIEIDTKSKLTLNVGY